MARKGLSFPFDIFDNPDGAFNLFENSIRSGMDYDANIEDQFDAIVLTRPVKVTSDPRFISFERGDAPGTEKFAFMVRILGNKSPHKFLPNPCLMFDLTTADAQRRAFNLIQQHTKVIMNASQDEPLPGINSIVRVVLERNRRGSFRTDFTKQFISIVNKDPKPPAGQQDCQKLIDSFNNSDILTIERVGGIASVATNPYNPSSFKGTGYLKSDALFDYITGAEGNINSFNRGTAGDSGAEPLLEDEPHRLSERTVAGVVALQKPKGDLLAVGKYQIIPATMTGFLAWVEANKGNFGIPADYDKNTTLFDESFQDLYKAYTIESKRPPVGKYLRGEGSLEDAALALAQEFASIGVPFDITADTHVRGSPGVDIIKNQSYYADRGGNKAFTPTEGIQEALKQARKANGHSI